MKLIELTQGESAMVDDEDYERLNRLKWHVLKYSKTWYAVHNVIGIYPLGKSVKMHRVIMNAPEGLDVDHIDRNGLNNQRHNLRLSTRSQNLANSGRRKDNTSGYKGVHRRLKLNKWCARIQVNRVRINIGDFDNPIDAAHAYDEFAIRYFGEFACINFPK